jgi:cofilin
MDSLEQVKAALDRGLIAQGDYDAAKGWFLFTHRIAQANQSGVLRAHDVECVRRAMLEAIKNGTADVSAHVQKLLDEALRGDGERGFDAAEDATVLRETTQKFNVKTSVAAQPTFMTKIEDAERALKVQDGERASASGEDASVKAAPPAPRAPAAPPAPPAAASTAKSAPAVEAKSMSGVAVAEDCLSVFNKVKMRSNGLQWATFRVEENEGSVLTAATGEVSGDYDDFIAALPESECRYAIYDYKYVNADDCEFSKLVFVVWNPDSARLKNKMLYASTKDFFKSRLSGIAVEIQATDYDEVSEAELRENIGITLTRK